MNSGPKTFIVFIFFMMMLLLFASSSLEHVDLTPDTPPAPYSADPFLAPAGAPAYLLTGNSCPGSYTVQPGDTLARIARTCGVNLPNLIAANPHLSNPNLIQPGQTIYIPGGGGGQVLLPDSGGGQAPVTAPTPTNLPTAQPAATQTPAQQPANQPVVEVARTDGSPVEGVQPGSELKVTLRNFPPNAIALVGVGLRDESPGTAGEGITDAAGSYSLTIKLPETAQAGENWVVSVFTIDDPKIDVISAPFSIGQ